MTGILAGKRAYVTGGSSGIGAAIVQAFAAEGARVAIGASRHADQARSMAKSLPSASGNHIVVQADFYDQQQTERAADEVIAGLGGLDIFVHSAGIDVTQTAPTHQTSDELWDRMIEVNVTSAFALCRDQKLPIRVFSIFKSGALKRVVQGEDEGTLVHV